MERSPELVRIDPDGTREREAAETGFLFDRSINYYEQHSCEALIERGYSRGQVELADRVLAKFDTSVGADLGRSPEDLWCIRPCAECGVAVDNREFNAIPFYGMVLCRADLERRDAERICSFCGGRFQDPAITDGLDVTVRHHWFFEKPTYLCNWCALTVVKGDTKFIQNRGAESDYKDLKRFIDQLGIIRKGEPRFMTSEEHQQLVDYVNRFEWYFDEQPGVEFENAWSDYYITYTGIVMGEGEKPRPQVTKGPGWYIWHPKDERKLVWICRVRILYKTSLAFIEVRFKNPIKPTFDIINANEIKTHQELRDVWKGRGVIYRIKEKSGTPFEYQDPTLFYELAVDAYVRVFERQGKDRVSIENVVPELLIGKSTYYETAKRFGIDPDKIRKEAKARYKLIRNNHLIPGR